MFISSELSQGPKVHCYLALFLDPAKVKLAEGVCGREQSSAHNIQQSEEGTGHQMRASVTHLPGVTVNLENSQFDGIWNRL